jgi:hypothetical protein
MLRMFERFDTRHHVTPVRVGLAVTIVALFFIVLYAAVHGTRELLSSDTEAFFRISLDPFGDGSILRDITRIDGDSYRYGRILYPGAVWLVSLGQANLVLWAMAIVFSAACGIAIGVAAQLLVDRGLPASSSSLMLLTPFNILWLFGPVLTSEPVFVALILSALLLWSRSRLGLAKLAASALWLTRAIASVALIPLVWRSWRDHGAKGLLSWWWVPVPWLVWSVYLKFRMGTFPFTDPSPVRREAIGFPLEGALGAITSASPPHVVVALLALATLLAAVVLAVTRRWFPVIPAAVSLALIIPLLGSSVFELWGEALRIADPIQMLIILGFTGGVRRFNHSPALSDQRSTGNGIMG